VAALAAAPRAATLGGVRMSPAGRLGPGWLLSREAAAMQPPVAATPGAVWDGRFRLGPGAALPAGGRLGALGTAAASLRHLPAARPLPAAVLATLPALWCHGELFAVPHLLYPDLMSCCRARLELMPRAPVACAPFVAAGLPGRCGG
jgi:tRNA(Ile)-lysidine synthase